MVIERKTGKISHKHFFDLPDLLTKNDVLVLNKTKVFPARFYGRRQVLKTSSGRLEGGGKIEVLLVEEVKTKVWKALTKPGLEIGQKLYVQDRVFTIVAKDGETRNIYTEMVKDELFVFLQKYGHTPLPPYIKNEDSELELRTSYQTVYAKNVGSVAAPTAGFHFTPGLIAKLQDKGVQIEYVTLHVGLGTFLPVKTTTLEGHQMHYENFEVEKEVAQRLNEAKKIGKRIIAVGTTTTRVLETCASDKDGPCQLIPQTGKTNLFIYPPYKYKFIDGLITNFHLPKSTLLALVSALVTIPNTKKRFTDFENSLIGKAYFEAIGQKYRFYSFGDACLIT